MTIFRLLAAAAVASLALSVPALARSHHHWRHHYHHHRHHGTGLDVFNHNYGPSLLPGRSFATYDGPLHVRCKRNAAAYRGQDGRAHPCN